MKNLLTLFTLSALTLGAGCLDPSESGNLVPMTADEDPEIPQLAFNGSVFHVETAGVPGAPVIVFLHGGPGGDFRGLLRLRGPVDGRRLEDDHFLVFWDQRGTGLSQRHDPDDVSGPAYDADLDWIITHFAGDRPVVLIGHSWGGMYATRYISSRPDRVAGAVLMEPGPLTGALFDEVKDDIVHLDFFAEWLNDYAWAERMLSPDDHARADYVRLIGMLGDAQPRFHSSQGEREPVWRLGAVAGAVIENEGMRDGKPVWDFTVGLDTFARKVLFEASANNEILGEAFQRRQMQAYAAAELAVIPDAGHDHPWSQPEQTLIPIFRYLDEIGF